MRALMRWVYRLAAKVAAGSNIERFAAVRWLNQFITALLRERTAVINGFTLHLDERDAMNLSILQEFEPVETALVQREIKPGQTVVDIGANLGYFTLLFSRLVGAGGKVYAFEPEPASFKLLEKNIAANQCSNIVAERKAVTDQCGTSRLYRSTEDSMDHRVYDSGDDRPSVAIETVTLDAYLDDVPVDFIKMDTQGAEPWAIAGMMRVLENCANVKVLTEFWPYGLDQCGTDPRALLDTLQGAGFALHEYQPATKEWAPAEADHLLARHTVANQRFTNLFCVRNKQSH